MQKNILKKLEEANDYVYSSAPATTIDHAPSVSKKQSSKEDEDNWNTDDSGTHTYDVKTDRLKSIVDSIKSGTKTAVKNSIGLTPDQAEKNGLTPFLKEKASEAKSGFYNAFPYAKSEPPGSFSKPDSSKFGGKYKDPRDGEDNWDTDDRSVDTYNVKTDRIKSISDKMADASKTVGDAIKGPSAEKIEEIKKQAESEKAAKAAAKAAEEAAKNKRESDNEREREKLRSNNRESSSSTSSSSTPSTPPSTTKKNVLDTARDTWNTFNKDHPDALKYAGYGAAGVAAAGLGKLAYDKFKRNRQMKKASK
jgi:hypothetical protein